MDKLNNDFVKSVDPELSVVVAENGTFPPITFFAFDSGKFEGIAFRFVDFDLKLVEDDQVEAKYGIQILKNADKIKPENSEELYKKAGVLAVALVEQVVMDITEEK